MSCIFCKIANGEIPSATLYENDEFRAILDLGPANKGHTLILPKKHYADLFEMPDELAAKAVVLAKKLMPAMKKALDCDGFQLVQNNGETAGQTVFHYHLHVIPAYKTTGPGAKWNPGKLDDDDAAKIPEAVSKELD